MPQCPTSEGVLLPLNLVTSPESDMIMPKPFAPALIVMVCSGGSSASDCVAREASGSTVGGTRARHICTLARLQTTEEGEDLRAHLGGSARRRGVGKIVQAGHEAPIVVVRGGVVELPLHWPLRWPLLRHGPAVGYAARDERQKNTH